MPLVLRWLLGVLVLCGSCYGHSVPARQPVLRPPLIAPMTGTYEIFRGGQRVGTESFTITSSAGIWRAKGVIQLALGTTTSTYTYSLGVDEETAEPVSFSVHLDLIGLRRSVKGEREGDYLVVTSSGIGGGSKRKVPYGKGTILLLESPLSHTLVLSLLLSSLQPGKPLTVRTIAVPVPLMEPEVILQSYERGTSKKEGNLVRVTHRNLIRPLEMVVREDGLPRMVRKWRHRGEPDEIRLR